MHQLQEITEYYQAGIDVLDGNEKAAEYLEAIKGETIAFMWALGSIKQPASDDIHNARLRSVLETGAAHPEFADALSAFAAVYGAILIGAATLEEKR